MKLAATIKVPESEVENIIESLYRFGVEETAIREVPFDTFVEESRMGYDCVFQNAFEEHKNVYYIDFSFADTQEGRSVAYRVEYNLKQIPINLRYDI